jgi:hypothetical protein
MLKKLLLIATGFCSIAFSTTITELLNSVQDIVTDYENTGKAEEYPFVYAKIEEYYRLGKLYAAYALVEPAKKMLQLAQCNAVPLDCKNTLYFKRNLIYKTYYAVLKKYPILLGRLEASYNAYADWWISKKLKGYEIYREYPNLEAKIKEEFFNNWVAFLLSAPKPIYFQISKFPTDWDRFLLKQIFNAYNLGYIKRIDFYGDKHSYNNLTVSGLINPYIVKFHTYKECRTYNFLLLY